MCPLRYVVDTSFLYNICKGLLINPHTSFERGLNRVSQIDFFVFFQTVAVNCDQTTSLLAMKFEYDVDMVNG